MTSLRIETPRLELIAATESIARVALEEPDAFGGSVDAEVPTGWPPIVVSDTRAFFARVLTADPPSAGWWIWYVVLRAPQRVLIGHAGFAGPPNPEGSIECGYALLEGWHRQGFATEALGALCSWAFSDPRVHRITGRTYPHLVASVRTMERNGFCIDGPPSSEGLVTLIRERPVSPGLAGGSPG